MADYYVTIRDVVTVSGETGGGGAGILEEISVDETYTFQSDTITETATVTETYGVPIVALSETATPIETYHSPDYFTPLSEFITVTETYDISTSILANPEVISDLIAVTEEYVSMMEYYPTIRESIQVVETYYAVHRVDYMSEDQYYYNPRQ